MKLSPTATRGSAVRKIGWLGVASMLALAMLAPSAGPAFAKADKYFVCKYVGTPGVDEVLQTGSNPISVAASAIPLDPVVVGAYFGDQHGRSYVLAEDIGQDEPPVSDCPTETTTTTTTTTTNSTTTNSTTTNSTTTNSTTTNSTTTNSTTTATTTQPVTTTTQPVTTTTQAVSTTNEQTVAAATDVAPTQVVLPATDTISGPSSPSSDGWRMLLIAAAALLASALVLTPSSPIGARRR